MTVTVISVTCRLSTIEWPENGRLGYGFLGSKTFLLPSNTHPKTGFTDGT